MDFETAFKKERLHIYAVAVLAVLAVTYLVDAVIFFRQSFLYHFLMGVFLTAALVILILRHRKTTAQQEIAPATEEQYHARFDRYTRLTLNWVMVAFWVVATIVMGAIALGVNSKADEILQGLLGNVILMQVTAFFLIKNILFVRFLNANHDYEKKPAFLKELRWVLVSSAIYWVVAGVVFYLFERIFVHNISAFLSVVFVIWMVLYNFLRINRFTYDKRKHNWVVIGVAAAVVLSFGGYELLSKDIWLTQPYINATPYIYESESTIAYDDATGIYTITKADGDFKILQITDVHLGGSVLSYDKDLLALKAVYALLEGTKPDLVIVTGDLVFPVGYASFSFNNTAPVQQFAAFMRNTGIPWAFTYGNHDTESYAATSEHDLDALYRSLSYKTSRTLLYPYVQPDITGRSNQLIEVRRADGTLFQGLFLIDSNAYTGEGLNKYDYIHDDQVEWYKAQVLRMETEAEQTVPSLVFFHIPLQQYRTAYRLWEQGSSEVTWYFGSNDETMMDKVCCSEYPSSLFDVAKELGSTQGFFCGHDHYNNMSLEYQGIRLTYGMSIDYLAMPGIARDTMQRGGTLITLHEDGSMDIVQVPLTSIVADE